MNLIQITKTICILLLLIAAFMLIPTLLALYYGEMIALAAFAITLASMLLVALPPLFLFRKIKDDVLSPRDGFLFVSVSWIVASLFGALPFWIAQTIPNFADAYFETMSGFTTTGASILTNIEALSQSMLFWRSLTHWLGGMGIVVLTVAILPLLGIGGLQLIRAEAPGPSVDKITPRITETAKIFWLVYLGFTIAETLLLMLGGMNLFDALTHTFGTLATGGFSPKNSSVGHYPSAYLHGVITVFMILAGMNFVLHYKLLIGNLRDVWRDDEWRWYLAIFFIATAIISASLYRSHYQTIGECIQYASFQAASILTTTGYATADFEKWPHLAQIVLFILMFIGGCAGSTGGGIKVIRLLTLFKKAINEMRYLLHPRGIFILRINDKPIKKDIVYAISGFFFLYIWLLLLTTLIVASSGQNILTSISAALVTVGNIGPGFGKIGPTENYAFFPTM